MSECSRDTYYPPAGFVNIQLRVSEIFLTYWDQQTSDESISAEWYSWTYFTWIRKQDILVLWWCDVHDYGYINESRRRTAMIWGFESVRYNLIQAETKSNFSSYWSPNVSYVSTNSVRKTTTTTTTTKTCQGIWKHQSSITMTHYTG